jgi:HK97 family phage major capsid protein
LEMSQEAETEARSLGLTLEGRAHIPHMLAFGTQKRDNSVTMPTQPEDGAAMVFPEQPLETLGLLRPRLAIAALGAQLITGLRGELPLPGMTQGAVATWKGESQPLDKSNIKFGRGVMKPHRLGTYIDVSKQFLIQATPGTDALLRGDLNAAMSQAIDTAAIYGTGLDADHQPLGILNTPGVYILAVADANGRVPTYADIIALEASPEIINANAGNLSGYLMNSKIKGTLKNTQVVNGQALMVLMNNTELNGAKLVVSNIVTDQQRGTATNASAIVYGSDWSNVILGQWGGLDLTVDNLTLALTGQNRIIVQSWWDVGVRRPNTFSAIRGVVPSAQIAALAPQP